MDHKFTPLQEAWLVALESDKYKQGTHSLKRQSPGDVCEHCCLGVACEVAIEHGVPVSVSQLGTLFHFDGTVEVLPYSVQEAFGFRSAAGSVEGEDDCDDNPMPLTELNDGARWSFKEIAAYVRDNPHRIFRQP